MIHKILQSRNLRAGLGHPRFQEARMRRQARRIIPYVNRNSSTRYHGQQAQRQRRSSRMSTRFKRAIRTYHFKRLFKSHVMRLLRRRRAGNARDLRRSSKPTHVNRVRYKRRLMLQGRMNLPQCYRNNSMSRRRRIATARAGLQRTMYHR